MHLEGDEQKVDSDAIIDTANYLEEMGYDLYGYGFTRKDDAITTDGENGTKKLGYDKNSGVYDYLVSYLVSDNYAYIIKNNNENFKAAIANPTGFLNTGLGWGTGLISIYRQDGDEKSITGKRGEAYGVNGIEALADTVYTASAGATAATLGAYAGVKVGATIGATVGSAVPVVGNIVGGVVGGAVGLVTGGTAGILVSEARETVIHWEDKTSSIDIDRDNKELKIVGAGLTNNTILTYSLDGWVGRYSMPLEFLLSVHLATLAPDLSYKLATSFPTDVEILLYTAEAETASDLNAGIKVGDSFSDEDIYTYKDFAQKNKTIFGDRWLDWPAIETLCFSKKDAVKVFKEMNRFKSQSEGKYKCQGAYVPKQIYPADELEYSDNSDSAPWLNGYNYLTGDQYPNLVYPKDSKEIDLSTEWALDNNGDKILDKLYLKLDGDSNWFDYLYEQYEQAVDNSDLAGKQVIPDGLNEEMSPENFERALQLEFKKNGNDVDKKSIVLDTLVPEDSNSGEHIAELNGDMWYIFNKEFELDVAELNGPSNIDYTFEFVISLYKKHTGDHIEDFMADDNDVECRIGVVVWENDYTKAQDAELNYCSARVNEKDFKKTCGNCRNYLRTIYGALAKLQESNFQTYVPYINRVTKHWFRDIYFTEEAIKLTEQETGKKVNIIQTDELYEKQKSERWTLYETYSGNSGEIESTDYKLYVYKPNENGEYDENFYKIDDGTYVLCKKVKEGTGKYKLKKDGTTYSQDDSGDYILVLNKDEYPEYTGETIAEFRVGKKAVINYENIWENGMAYDSNPAATDKTWKTVEVKENTADIVKEVVQDLNLDLVYQHIGYTVKQIEDGVRAETNPTIKKLFLDDYYLYDGSKERAALIEAAKENVKKKLEADISASDASIKEWASNAGEDYETSKKWLNEFARLTMNDPDAYRELFPNTEISATIENKEDNTSQTYKATIDQLSGPISLQHTALSAFSMLKNMHTLDAEYIYHDFKELIVELNYFDKEDLVEPESEVMMFPVQGVSSEGWPDVRYDKSEEFYGTLIHSAQDYEAKRAQEAEELAKLLKNDHTKDKPLDESNISSNPTNSSIDENGKVTYSNNIFLQAAEDIHKYMEDNLYTYCVFGNNDYEQCGSGEEHGLNATFEESKNGYHHSCCATYVMWVCKAIGIPNITTHGADKVLEQCELSDYFEVIDYSTDALQAGDIVHTSSHVQIFAGYDSAGNMTWYNAGSGETIQKDSPYVMQATNWDKIMRIKKWDGLSYNGITGIATSNGGMFAGYSGGEPILAPITGEVIKYGTVTRRNIETNEEEEVGFIKIRALGADENVAGKECTIFGGEHKAVTASNQDPDSWIQAKYTEEEIKKLGYDYFWEEYNEAGLSDNVLYIEGIDVSQILGQEVDKEKNATENISSLQTYITSNESQCIYTTKYRVPNLVNDNREYELKVQEEAKKLASYTVTLGDKIYIKEGAVIGHTYTAEKAKLKDVSVKSVDENGNEVTQNYKVGNYMRMILRDTQDEIKENIEDYMEVEKNVIVATNNSSGQAEALISTLGITPKEPSYENLTNANKYWDKIVQYSNEFGLDPFLVRAMICRESGGDPTSDNDSAYGLMQWEYTANGESITVPNASGQDVTINGITKEALAASVDLQIRAGCAELKKNLLLFENNLCATLVGYNFGTYGCYGVLNYHAEGHSGSIPHHANQLSDKGKEYLKSGDIGWVTDDDRQNYRNTHSAGDPKYIENVLQYYNTNLPS